jgi:hypothetical protein
MTDGAAMSSDHISAAMIQVMGEERLLNVSVPQELHHYSIVESPCA